MTTHACSYDGQFNNPFTESFPGSLDIAMATHDAFAQKLLENIETLEGKQGLRRASWWLKLMAKQKRDDLQSVSYIYLIERHLWTKVSSDQNIEIHVSPISAKPSSVMLISEAALQALAQGKVNIGKAIERLCFLIE
ncbi:hypothetical protein [Vibrio vulnificus]|uniref:hypothetical protein n=1 Tax=Vibrio vulnificus TaxID=672 RepID=UPI001F5FD17F|nr:hypothetical protein [Vibrio vulnificus]